MPRERVTFEVIHDHPSGELKFWRHDLARAFLNCQKLGIVVDRWIPVTDRLPERNEKVLVVDEGGVNIGSYSPMLDDWWSLQEDRMAPGPKVTHWMPLPENPVRSVSPTPAGRFPKTKQPPVAMSNIVERLRDRAYAFKAPDPLMEEAANEIERLRDLRDTWHLVRSKLEKQIKFLEAGGPCPYVVGKTTLHCSLTPFTLTDEEREAIEMAYSRLTTDANYEAVAATLRGLLNRTA